MCPLALEHVRTDSHPHIPYLGPKGDESSEAGGRYSVMRFFRILGGILWMLQWRRTGWLTRGCRVMQGVLERKRVLTLTRPWLTASPNLHLWGNQPVRG